MRPNRITRRLLGEAGPSRWHLAGTVLLGLVVTGLIIAQAGLLAHLLAGAGSGDVTLGAALWLLLGVAVARAAATYGGEATALRAAAGIKARLRSRLAARLLTLGPGWLAGERSGELITLAGPGLDTLDPYFSRYLPQLVLAVTVPVAVLIRVTAADWLSGLVIATTLPLIPVFAALVGMRASERSRRQYRALARLSGHFLDVVQGLTTLKVFGRARAQERVIARITEEYRVSVMATLRLAFLSSLVLELSAALATALVAVEIGLRLLYGHIGYSSALVVLLLTPEAYLPLRNAGAAFHASADGAQAAGRVFEILDLAGGSGQGPDPIPADPAPGPVGAASSLARPDRSEVKCRHWGKYNSNGTSPPLPKVSASANRHPVPAGRRIPDPRRDTIVLRDVTVAYPGRPAPALDRVSLEIRPGDQITLTGPNGAGKSTLAHLLLRFAEPESGQVLAGGMDVTGLPVAAWRERIGWMPQRPWLFPWSVAENIALGRPSARRDEIIAAARAAGAGAFIEELPGGFDTVLGEQARQLSAGQRQRLALARLFLADRPLLILDEPTAHLDPVSAAGIDRAIAALAGDRTVITITHREHEAAGRLLTLTDGRLTEATPARTSPTASGDVPRVPAPARPLPGDVLDRADVLGAGLDVQDGLAGPADVPQSPAPARTEPR